MTTSRPAPAPTTGPRATVSAMRTVLLVCTLLPLLAACAWGGGGGNGGSSGTSSAAEQVESTTTSHAEQALPAVAEALGAEVPEVVAQWQSCMALSWRYEAFATFTVPEAERDAQLGAVRDALTSAGWTDATQVDGRVTLERDDTVLDVTPAPARGPRTWTATVASTCAGYDGDDRDRVEGDQGRPLDLS